MKDSLEDVYDDVNEMQESLLGCVSQTMHELRGELLDMESELEREMDENDFRNSLNAFIFNSQNRLAMTVDYLEEGESITWLASLVSEGLQSCLAIGSLTNQISATSIVAVMQSLAYVSKWFDTCRMFLLFARTLADVGDFGVPFKATFATEQIVGEQFKAFYKRIRCIEPELSSAVRPLELKVLNFINLVKAEHYHAIKSFKDFPRRQAGQNQNPFASTGGYYRRYSLGAAKTFSETCRFCREDGETDVHYGCWEEQAVSFDSCVGGGGIYYNGSLSVSNEFSCEQFRDFAHMLRAPGTTCGSRNQQETVVEPC
jgi:hypothetical protein